MPVEVAVAEAHNQTKAKQDSNPLFLLISIKLAAVGSSNDKKKKGAAFLMKIKMR